MRHMDVQQPVGGCFTAPASSMLSQCVQYHHASKFTAVTQHFPFIVFYRCGDTHWSWQIILFIIEHYLTHPVIRFISCPTCLYCGRYESRHREEKLDASWIISLKNCRSEIEMLSVFVVPERNIWPSHGDPAWHVLVEMRKSDCKKK